MDEGLHITQWVVAKARFEDPEKYESTSSTQGCAN